MMSLRSIKITLERIPCDHGYHQNGHTSGFLAIYIGCLATICKTVNNIIILLIFEGLHISSHSYICQVHIMNKTLFPLGSPLVPVS